jgi:hypothetical protein
MSHLVLGVFHDREEALAVIDALVRQGVAGAAIGLLATHPERFPGPACAPLSDVCHPTVPGLGPLVCAGPLGEAMRASPAWPAERAIADCLVRRGIGSATAHVAIDAVRRGAIVLTVHDADHSRSESIFEQYRPGAVLT